MATSRQDIEGWLARAPKEATHKLVLCDTFDWSDYPVYCADAAEARGRADKPGEVQKFMECYRLDMDLQQQRAEHRARNF